MTVRSPFKSEKVLKALAFESPGGFAALAQSIRVSKYSSQRKGTYPPFDLRPIALEYCGAMGP